MADPGFEVIAHTVQEGVLGTEYLVALENTFGLTICALDLRTQFLDSSGTLIDETRGLVETPPHRGSSGSGGLVSNCLGPGQVGMQSIRVDLGTRTIDDIASITWVIGGINLTDAASTDDIGVSGIVTEPDDFGGNRFTGQFDNDTSGTLRFPDVSIFGLNAVGRPLFESGAIQDTTVPAGGSWTFHTSPGFDDTFASTAAFAKANEP